MDSPPAPTPSSSASPLSSDAFNDYAKKLQQAALQATRHAAPLPADVKFHRSMDATFSNDLDAFSSRLLTLTNKLLSLAGTVDTAPPSRDKGKAKLKSLEDITDAFHSVVVDSMDQLLERTDICLDECLGRTKPPAIVINPPPATKTRIITKTKPSGPNLNPALQHASHIPKPQLSFKRKVDNSDAPWYPSIAHKYNAKVPLGYDYRDSQDTDDEGTIQMHPYRYEITHFIPPPSMFVVQTPVSPPPIADTSFTWVTTKEDFDVMLAKLRQSSEIAVDLEHHSYRTYAGFVCLMQLSTRQEDWIIDSLVLRDELEELNEVFTNPDIVKVFHGADSDIVWLQQDFNLYIVNLFDTFHASKALAFPRHGLANLLEMYCDFIPDKRYQLADWRIRPLPDEMLSYARSDTHFLLYIYDCLRNALLDRSLSLSGSSSPSSSSTPTPNPNGPHSLLYSVVRRSRETSLRTYQKELYDPLFGTGPNGWDTLARKWNKPLLFANSQGSFGEAQRSVFRAVHAWRDKLAREEDESIRYILPNRFLFQLAEGSPNDLVALLNVFSSVPPPVIRRRAKELLDVIQGALKLSSPDSQPAAAPKVEFTSVETAPSSKEDTIILSEKWNLSTTERDVWATDSNAIFTAKGSSLFTPMQPPAASSISTLLRGFRNASPPPSFKELLSRINRTLVIAPAIPKVTIPEQSEMTPLQADEADVTNILGMQVEIPFIPAAERTTKVSAKHVEDTIVVVGKARPKKRKRGTTIKANPQKSGSRSPSAAEDEDGASAVAYQLPTPREDISDTDKMPAEQGSFDFSAVPNILDNNRTTEEAAERKRARSDKADGNSVPRKHSAPRRARNDYRGGNRLRTFKG